MNLPIIPDIFWKAWKSRSGQWLAMWSCSLLASGLVTIQTVQFLSVTWIISLSLIMYSWVVSSALIFLLPQRTPFWQQDCQSSSLYYLCRYISLWNCPSRKADYLWMSNRRLCIGGYVSSAEVPSDMVSWCWIQDRSVRQGSEQPTSVRPDGSFTSVLHQWQTFYHTFSSWSYPWSWSHEAQCSRHHAFWCYPGGH